MTPQEFELKKLELKLKEREVLALERLAAREPASPPYALQTISKWWKDCNARAMRMNY